MRPCRGHIGDKRRLIQAGGGRLRSTPRRTAFPTVFLSALVLGALIAGCGSSSSSGTVTLNWFVATQPGGTIQEVAQRCSDESNGRYTISVNLLPTDATQQREQLVRRLAAKDSTVDLIGMDVIWTAEFANAGWIKPFPDAEAQEATKGDFPSVIKTATFNDQIYGAPF